MVNVQYVSPKKEIRKEFKYFQCVTVEKAYTVAIPMSFSFFESKGYPGKKGFDEILGIIYESSKLTMASVFPCRSHPIPFRK
jgi:hypothetical protein